MNKIINTNNDANQAVTSYVNNSGNSVQLELPFANRNAGVDLIKCDSLIDKMVQSVGIIETINTLLLKTQIIKSRTIIAFFRHDAKYLTISYDHFIRDFCAGQILCTRRTFEQARDYVKIINRVDNPELQNKLKSLSVSVVRHLYQFLDDPNYLNLIKQIFDNNASPTEAEIKDFVRALKADGTRAKRPQKIKKKPKTIARTLQWIPGVKQSQRIKQANIKFIVEYLKSTAEFDVNTVASIETLILSLIPKKGGQ